MTGGARALSWAHGVVSVEALGGMLGPTIFVLPDGRQVSPFHIAHWASEPGGEALPGILRRLRGEWPCVPFGSDGDRSADGGWPVSTTAGAVDANAHGYSSNHDWTLQDSADAALELNIAYPEAHPIASLRRRLTPDPQSAALDFELSVTPRRDCALPIGLHPVFRLPQAAGAMWIEVEGDVAAATYPGDPDASLHLRAGAVAEDWHALRLRDGSTFDPSRVPLRQHTEEVLQLRAPGRVGLWNAAEGYRVRLSWNADDVPSVMLGFIYVGRQAAPWSGRHLALGVEPICAALDLGPQISAQPNPISATGVPTVHRFTAGETFVTRYRVAVERAPVG